MEPNDSPDFDLAAFVADRLPELVEAEAAEAWGAGFGEGRDVSRPVTALTADNSPLQTFLRTDPTVDEALPRPERAAAHEQWRAARDAAEEAAQNAAEDHARWVEIQRARRAADALDGVMARAAKRAEERENGTTAIPVRDAERPAESGRW